jgi:hypothetical protein
MRIYENSDVSTLRSISVHVIAAFVNIRAAWVTLSDSGNNLGLWRMFR